MHKINPIVCNGEGEGKGKGREGKGKGGEGVLSCLTVNDEVGVDASQYLPDGFHPGCY